MPRYTDKQIEDALRHTRGMRYLAAQRLGCNHHTIISRIAKNPRIRAVAEEEQGKLLDIAEIKLATKINEGDVGAIRYYLSTQGRHRGYGEQLDLTTDGQPMRPEVVIIERIVSDPSASDLAHQLLAALAGDTGGTGLHSDRRLLAAGTPLAGIESAAGGRGGGTDQASDRGDAAATR